MVSTFDDMFESMIGTRMQYPNKYLTKILDFWPEISPPPLDMADESARIGATRRLRTTM